MDLVGFLAGICALACFAVTVWHFHNWSALGWVVVAYGVLSNSDAGPVALFRVGGIQVFKEDALVGLLLLVALFSGRNIWRNLGKRLGIPLALGALLVFSLAAGFLAFGIPAIVEFRPFFYFFGCLVWALSLDWSAEKTKKHVRYFLYICGWGLVLIAAMNISRNGIASSSDMFIDEQGAYHTLRPVVASQAAMLAAAGLFALYEWGKARGGKLLLSGIAFAAIVVIAQHRSVWVAFAAGSAMLGWRAAQGIRSRVVGLTFVSLICVTVLALSGTLDAVINSIVASLDAVTASNSTLTDRTSGWESLVADSWSEGPAAVLFGQPFGTGYLRIGPNGLPQTYAPHNWYVSMYLRTGCIGALALVGMFLGALVRLGKQRSVWTGVMACLVVFALAYSLQWYLAPLIAAALAVANMGRSANPESQPKKAPHISDAYRHMQTTTPVDPRWRPFSRTAPVTESTSLKM